MSRKPVISCWSLRFETKPSINDYQNSTGSFTSIGERVANRLMKALTRGLISSPFATNGGQVDIAEARVANRPVAINPIVTCNRARIQQLHGHRGSNSPPIDLLTPGPAISGSGSVPIVSVEFDIVG